ncbi:Protein of unknown function [Lutibacter oricola]|uniref:DUF1573 domain-containing protein n=1 Tax=Lutibacter oricola TaxID=762486 RepID=A0A1H3AMP3_9FLAO|nr:DUF1573 domain-containing protein [Lutibacter oricola]SDX30109.1 Protein of unknown function [Lutibacter oricola]
MKKNILFLLAIAFCTLSYSQNNQGILSFESETIDYGNIEQNADGNRYFVLTNTGNQPIIIEKIKSSCGCTVVSKPDKPILPNKTAKIKVNYATNRIGGFSKMITVYSNASEARKVVRIKGIVNSSKKNIASTTIK